MLRSFNTSVSSFALFAAANDEGQPEKAEKGQAAVYLTGDETIKSVMVHCEHAAGANLAFCASMVVHLTARLYTPILRDRVKLDDVKTEILNAVRESGKAKRGKEFGRAWSYRILSLAMKFGRSLMTDYDRKGVTEGSPLHNILRAKTADKAIETVLEYMKAKTKTAGEGGNDLQTLERALEPAKAKAPAKGAKAKGKGSNASKPATVAATAKTLMSDHFDEVIAAVPAKSGKDRANKLADRMGASNTVDHVTFVMRSLTFINDADALIRISDKCIELAKAMHAKSDETGEDTAAVA